MIGSDAAACDDANDANHPHDEDDEDTRATNRLRASDRRRRLVAVVVDDSDDAQALLRRGLEDCGYIVHQARDGKAGLELLIDLATPDLIVVDLLMPVMNGFELLDVICSYARLSNVPMLVVSASEEGLGQVAPRCGYLKKPILAAELAAAVAQLPVATRGFTSRRR
jgi:CheY-like chemotaxis protein